MASDGDSDLPAEPAERVRAILERVVDALEVEADVEVDEDAEQIVGRVDGEDVGLLIGRRGQTIDAVQLLCYRAAFRGLQERKRVVVDAAGYRERRQEAIERQADRAAERALKTGEGDRARADDPERASRRPSAPQGSRRGRDLQRG